MAKILLKDFVLMDNKDEIAIAIENKQLKNVSIEDCFLVITKKSVLEKAVFIMNEQKTTVVKVVGFSEDSLKKIFKTKSLYISTLENEELVNVYKLRSR